MKKIIALAAAAICGLTLAAPMATPANAQSFSFGWGVDVGPGWRDRGPRWDRWERPYRPYSHRWHPRRSGITIDLGPVDVRVRGSRSWRAHVERCEARYRSYNAATDTYLGYDGLRHRCRL